jgi:signal transduction histidine kinase
MKEVTKILFVEDVQSDAELIWNVIGREKITFGKMLVDNEQDYVAALSSYRPDLVISDYSLPQFDGFTALAIKNSLAPDIPFILVTGSVNEETAVEIMKAGADDYVIKDNLSRLGGAIRSAIAKKETQKIKEEALSALREGEERLRQILADDVAESRKMQEMLTRERDRAEENDRLKTAFLHNISHEIRTPMNAIIGFTALMAEPGQSDDVRASYSEIIMNSCNQLIDVVSDIIEISNIEAGILTYRKEIFNINSLLASLHRQYQVKGTEKNLMFSYVSRIGDDEAVMETDHAKLVTILTSLLNNAFKFTRQGRVELGCEKEGSHLLFHVSDTGIGIPAEEQHRIFERFYQVEHTASRNYEGAGLGLSISKAYAEFLGGKIWVESVPGEGSRFVVRLPLFRAEEMKHESGGKISGRNIHSVFSRDTLAADDDSAGERRMVI